MHGNINRLAGCIALCIRRPFSDASPGYSLEQIRTHQDIYISRSTAEAQTQARCSSPADVFHVTATARGDIKTHYVASKIEVIATAGE
jgi:hypothetical protein